MDEYDMKVVTYGNCMICGRELDGNPFFCKECRNLIALVYSSEKQEDQVVRRLRLMSKHSIYGMLREGEKDASNDT